MGSFAILPVPATVVEKVRRLRRDEHGNTDLHPLVAEEKSGYPCRVCLQDAEPGQSVLLFSYSPFNTARPYRNLGPIFVHANECKPYSDSLLVPSQLRKRLLALRSYDQNDRMLGCDVVEGTDVEVLIRRLFEDEGAQYIHVHNARAGCFACLIKRGEAA